MAAVAATAAVLLLAGSVQGAGESVVRAAARAWQSVFPDRPKTQIGERMIVVLSSPSVAERAAASRHPTPAEERRWAAEIEGLQRTLLAGLRERGLDVRPDHVFTHVLNGFSAVLDSRAVAELERNPIVVGIYPVRAVYPAELETSGGPGLDAGVELSGFDGSGVRVALLDTGVDRTHPGLHGRVETGYDVLAHRPGAAARTNPDDPGRLETHGTRMAGLVLGVAPASRILPLRIVGWQQGDGAALLAGRSDVLVAGLEHAVDPNGDGSTADAVDVALAPVVEPFASFADAPEARAVGGATDLGTLVVAPAGNDGDSGTAFGAVAAPGGAADALSVGALDTRSEILETDATLVAGGNTLLDGPARLLNAVGTGRGFTVAVAALVGPSLADPGRAPEAEPGGAELGDFFDARGVSRVAGRAAVVPADGTSLARKAANAKAAGATALLVYGTDIPAGALDVDEDAALPVVALPAEVGREALAAVRSGESVALRLGPSRAVGNAGAGRVAAFSSGGLAFDGRPRPDVVAPGIGLATDDARVGSGGRALYATATGSSAAAAVAAGAAALVRQAHPHVSPREVRAALVASATPLGEGVTRQGSGLVNPGAAVNARVLVEPATLAFGRASGERWSATQVVTVRNVSRRAREIGFAFVSDQPGESLVDFTAEPARLNLGPRASAQVTLGIRVREAFTVGASGVLLVTVDGAGSARVPWAIGRRPADPSALVGTVSLSNWEFEPSKSAPSVVAFRVGRALDAADGGSIEPVGRLEVELWTPGGKRLGVIATLRDLLPGRYAFGLTGRDANGKILPAGTYVLRLRAQPVDPEEGTPPATAQTVFRIKERS